MAGVRQFCRIATAAAPVGSRNQKGLPAAMVDCRLPSTLTCVPSACYRSAFLRFWD